MPKQKIFWQRGKISLAVNQSQADSQLAAEWEEMQKARLFPTIKQKSILSAIWFVSALYGLTFCYQDKVN